ncbi:MAG TPA: OmpH family outer membrane protein [Candidatus Thioglobus sp.]|nr:OmpH family outer membrane protein [Candidatus Thioglobus sp.]
MRVFALFLLAFLAFPVTAESIKIGYIDTEKVVNSLTQYQQKNADIIQEFESKKQELLDLFNHIELVRANLNKIDKSLNESNFQIELNKVLALESSFQQETEYWQEKINQKKIDLLQKIEIVVNEAIKEFAITEGYDLILYENAAFVSKNVNISNKIISIIEEM